MEISDAKDDNRWYEKVSWVLFNITSCVAFGITLGYWSFIYDPTQEIDTENVVKHVLNSVMMFIEIFVAAIPVRLLHIWQPLLYISLYGVFTIIYWLAGGTNDRNQPYIYGVLNYEENTADALMFLIFGLIVGIPLFFILVFALFKLRTWMVQKIQGNRSKTVKQTTKGLEKNEDNDAYEQKQDFVRKGSRSSSKGVMSV